MCTLCCAGVPSLVDAEHMDESLAARLLLALSLSMLVMLPFTFLLFGLALPLSHACLLRVARVRWPFWYVRL